MDVLAAAETYCQHDKDHYAPYAGAPYTRGKSPAAAFPRRKVMPAILLGVLSAYLSWGLSKGLSPAMRVLGSFLAFLFGGLYLLYYVLFGMWCKK